MARHPSERELLLTLSAAAESDNADEELTELLREHGSTIAALLGTTVAQLEVACKAPPMTRTVNIRVALRRVRERHSAALKVQAQARAIEAAEILARNARWNADHVELDPNVVLGALLYDGQRKVIRFKVKVEENSSVTIMRDKLKEASRALRFSDLRCFIDDRGLNFRWHGGRGGLVLVTQGSRYQDAASVLTVELQEPQRETKSTPQAPSSGRQAPIWLGDVLRGFGFV